MSTNDPGIQYPGHLVESDPNHAALKVVFDNLFFLRKSIQNLPKSINTLTRQEISQLVNQVINNTVVNITGATPTIGTHAQRLITTATLGALFFETDRYSLYIGSNATGVLQWEWTGGNMIAALTAIPADLGTPDIGFLFTNSDAISQTQYAWDGTKFVTVGGQLQRILDANTDSLLFQMYHQASGAAPGVGYAGDLAIYLDNAAKVKQGAVLEQAIWTNAGAGTEASDCVGYLRKAGAALAEVWRFIGSSYSFLVQGFIYWKANTAFTGALTHINTANRAYTFPDATSNVVCETASIVDNNIALGNGGSLIKDAGFAFPAITGATIPLAKITGGGTDGSITVSVNGLVTAYVAPT